MVALGFLYVAKVSCVCAVAPWVDAQCVQVCVQSGRSEKMLKAGVEQGEGPKKGVVLQLGPNLPQKLPERPKMWFLKTPERPKEAGAMLIYFRDNIFFFIL